jgi:dinuclear metal center YbgI/SA1388 family protein
MMTNLKDVITALEQLAPPRLAAEWDNVGLLVGTARPTITRLMTCLTLTPEVAREAVAEQADLVVSHHPLPFRPVKRITNETATGSVLLELLATGIGVWSGHTAWDSAAGGINQLLAETLDLEHVGPIEPDEASPDTGFGRMGTAPAGRTVADLARRLTALLGCPGCHVAGTAERAAGRVGIVCGSGGESVATVAAAGCQTLVTGEIKLHDALAAVAHDLAVVAVGHHASERFAMEVLADRIASSLPEVHCWASRTEADPLVWLPADPQAAPAADVRN